MVGGTIVQRDRYVANGSGLRQLALLYGWRLWCVVSGTGIKQVALVRQMILVHGRWH